MALDVDVSVIIPTYNRRELVCRAINSVLAQSRPVAEILVVDDGSTDGTMDALGARYGEQLRCVSQPNAGVAAARNHGLRLAQGRFIAFLDSDDEWEQDKTRQQREWLDDHPDFGMVLCDVMRVNARHEEIEHFRRRDMLPVDGLILKWVLLHPTLVPTSLMMRREVVQSVGGFDESLQTGEDLDFHLRVAALWPIGVIEAPLVRAMRGHDGLSSLPRTYDDYIAVIERAAAAAEGKVEEADRRRALARAYARNARGLLYARRWRDALRLARNAWRQEPDVRERLRLLRLAPLAARSALAAMRASR